MQQSTPTEGKKKKYGLFVVLAVLLVLAGAFFGITAFLENDALNKDAILAEELQVTAFAKLTSFSYTAEDGESMTYTLSGTDWVCSEYPDFPLIYTKVQDMANAFADIEAVRTLEDPSDLAEYGLDTPKYRLELADGKGYSATVLFGNPASTGWYVMVEGDSRVFVVEATLVDEFIFDVYEILRYDRIPGYLLTEVVAVDFAHNGNSYHYALDHQEGAESAVSTMNGAAVDISYEQVMDALKILDEWIIHGCALYAAEEAQLPAYGFDEPLASITIDAYDVSEDLSKTIEVVFGGIDETGDFRYFMVDGNMQILYGDNYDAEGIVIDLTTEGLEELQGGISLGDLVGSDLDG